MLHSEKDIAKIGSLDQSTQGMRDLAQNITAFFHELRKQKLSRHEALLLSNKLLEEIIRRAQPPDV